MPANMYWKDFLKVFTDLKLIMMLRDEEKWLESWKRHWYGRNTGDLSMPLSIFSPTARRCIGMFNLEAETFFDVPQTSFRKMYQGISDQKLKEVFRQHNKSLIEDAPKDRLLIMNLKDGWKPLCEFLNLPIPDEEFPHCNMNARLLHEQRARHPLFKRMYLEMNIVLSIIAITILLISLMWVA